MFFSRKYERGQILLVVILAAVVVLTVGIAAISRSITNTRVTTTEENSQKALSAAEAGVEELAGNASYASGSTGTKTLSNNSTFNAKVFAISPLSPFALNGGQLISKDDGADIWLSTYPNYTNQWNGTLTVYWKQNGTCSTEAALEIVVLTGASTNNPNVYRYAVDRCPGSRPSSNGFVAPTSSAANVIISGVEYDNSYTLPAISSGFIARVIPLYNDTNIAVGYTNSSANAFPSQGSIITSTGTSGDTHRTIQVVKGYPRVPIEFFPYNIFLPQ